MARILVVTQHFWPENFRVNDMVEGFLEHGHEVDVLCGLPNYPKGEWFPGYRYSGPRRESYKGAQLYRAGEIPRKGNTGLRIFANYCSWPVLALPRLGQLPGNYDAILCYNTSPVLMALPALVYGGIYRTPVTTYVLDIWPENLYSVLNVENRLLRAVAQGVSNWFYRRANKLIAMSPGLQRRLAERTGKPLEQIAVIPQYCEDFYAVPACSEALRQQYKDKTLLVFTGNFSPAQSLDTVVRAAVKAKAKAPDLHLLLVGDGMSRPELEKLVDELNARDTVTFYGSVPPGEIPAIGGAADGLVVSLSDSPDLGLTVPAKVASYMAMGKPLLASMDGEGYKAVRESGAGYVSAACDVDGLAENMVALAGLSSGERQTLADNAVRYYRENYARDKLLGEVENFILN